MTSFQNLTFFSFMYFSKDISKVLQYIGPESKMNSMFLLAG